MKKIAKVLSLSLVICLLFSTNVSAEEPITDMTYDEWLEEQTNIEPYSDMKEVDLEPVRVVPDNDVNTVQTYNAFRSERTGPVSLESIFEVTGKVDLSDEVSTDNIAANLTSSISGDDIMPLTAPTASLIPVIFNEDSLYEGQITTDTIIVFFFNDSDADSDTIVGRYVDGNAVDFILGEIDGGFAMQITVPGTYQLFYQVEDSAGEFSRLSRFTIDVIEAPVEEKYQVFEGSFTSVDDSVTYNFSIDFTEMDSAAVCLVRKGYNGASMTVYDEDGNQLFLSPTGNRQAKNWGFIDKPSDDATICNYTVTLKPTSHYDDSRSSDYRIIIGDKKDTELMMSGIENTVLLDQYYDSKVNLQNNYYVPNVGEYWFKFRRESTSVITILSSVDDIRFRILNVDTLDVMFDSAAEPDTHRTSFTGKGAWICAEKARLTTVVGTEYYLVVYCTNPDESLFLREGDMATAVGNPVMGADIVRISPGTSVTATKPGFSSTTTFSTNTSDIPVTGQVDSVTFSGTGLSNVPKWRASAPNQSTWVENISYNSTINFNYVPDATTNARIKGTWSVGFQSSASSYTFTPSYNFTYYYEYGD